MGGLVRLDANDVMMRPSKRDGVVRMRAAELALPEVKRWLGPDSRFKTDGELVRELMKHIDLWCGLEIVKSLENEGWCGNDSLVEIFSGGFIDIAEKELVAQWVKCLGVKLGIALGVTVECQWGIGAIVRRDEALGQYGVQASGERDSCWIVNAEDVKLPLCVA